MQKGMSKPLTAADLIRRVAQIADGRLYRYEERLRLDLDGEAIRLEIVVEVGGQHHHADRRVPVAQLEFYPDMLELGWQLLRLTMRDVLEQPR